jgi:hypothetical protein
MFARHIPHGVIYGIIIKAFDGLADRGKAR